MKRKACMIIALLVAVITAVNIAYVVKDEFFYSLEDLPQGECIRQREINQDIFFRTGYYLQVFEVVPDEEDPSAHTKAIRVAVKNDVTGENRTIYWQIGTSESLVYWPENQGTVVYINGVPVDYVNGSYDCRDYDNFTYVPSDDRSGNNDF